MANEPGWFPDPWRPGRRRWWDGSSWTDDTFDPEAPAAPIAPPEPQVAPPRWPTAEVASRPAADAATDLQLEQRAARRAHPAIALQAAAQVVNLITTAFAASATWDALQSPDNPSSPSGWETSQQLAAIPVLLALVLLMLWSHRVATIGRNLHYPARRSPVWAAAGWLLPIVNIWFPYRSIRDSLAPGNPDQHLVGRWWGCYIASTYWVIPVFAVGVASPALALAIALPGVVTALLSARFGFSVVDAVLADHTAGIGRALGPGHADG